MRTQGTASCAAIELFELGEHYSKERDFWGAGRPSPVRHTPAELADFAITYAGHRPFILFSDTINKSQAGINLAKYIRRHPELGRVMASNVGYNSAHKSYCRYWVWTRNMEPK